jgi:hypothetical protein
MIDQMVRDEEKNKGQGHAYAKGHDKPKADPSSGTGDDIGASCCTPPDGNGGPDTKP